MRLRDASGPNNISLYDTRNGSNSIAGTIALPQEKTLIVPVFLLGYDETESMAMVCGELEETKKALLEQQEKRHHFELEATSLQRTVESMKASMAQVTKTWEQTRTDAESWRKKNVKLEADHAKLEKEIGGVRMREILGCVPTPDAQKPKL